MPLKTASSERSMRRASRPAWTIWKWATRRPRRLSARDSFGAWKFCEEDDLRRIVGDNPTPLKLAAMIDAGKSDWHSDVLPKKDSVLDLIRVAFYVTQVSEAVDMIKDAYRKGYEVSANLMAVTTAKEQEIDQALEVLAETPAKVLVVVDSYGAMYAEQVEILVKKYLSYGKAHGQGGGHPRPQQSATGLCQHDRGRHPRGQSCSTPRWAGWAAGPAIAPWNCSSVSSAIPSSRFAPSIRCCRSNSCR